MRLPALILLFAAVLPTLSFAGAAPLPKPQDPLTPPKIEVVSPDSLVRVNSSNQAYDFFHPWAKKSPYLRRGLGVVLSGGRVLVTAELVANHTYVELEKPGSAEKSPAEVVAVDYDCNLALLKPTNEEFIKGAKPVEISKGARAGDTAEIMQLESNGAVALTPAVVTTVAVSDYPMDHLALLVYRMSAPLQNRDGSFTIPAMKDGELLGLLMRYDSRSQTAEVIPPPVITHFLADAELPEYPGFPRAGLSFATTRDPQLRRYIDLKENGGVYVTDVVAGSPAEKAGIAKGDVILAVKGKPVDQDGNYEDSDYGKISFSHLTNTLSRSGETVDMTVLRKGEKQTLQVKLEPADPATIISEAYLMNKQPRYLIVGGLVFEELSRPYLQEWGNGWRKEAPQKLVYLDAYQDELPKDHGKIVFLSQVLPGPTTVGYERLEHLVVTKVNGVEVKNLNDLAKALTTPQDGFQKIEFDEDPKAIYLDAAEAEQANQQLQETYSIPALQNLK